MRALFLTLSHTHFLSHREFLCLLERHQNTHARARARALFLSLSLCHTQKCFWSLSLYLSLYLSLSHTTGTRFVSQSLKASLCERERDIERSIKRPKSSVCVDREIGMLCGLVGRRSYTHACAHAHPHIQTNAFVCLLGGTRIRVRTLLTLSLPTHTNKRICLVGRRSYTRACARFCLSNKYVRTHLRVRTLAPP